jgi:hypothetical protein
MKKIPTAEEFLNRDESGIFNEVDITHAMIEFTKLHVEAALKAAANNIEVNCDSSDTFQSVNEQSILNAYPLINIK